jgi:hypothetical protein
MTIQTVLQEHWAVILLGIVVLYLIYTKTNIFETVTNTDSSTPTVTNTDSSTPTANTDSSTPTVTNTNSSTPTDTSVAPQTIYGVGNAYTGLECIDDLLPLYSQDKSTFTAISSDGKTPLYRRDLNIPNTVFCRDPNMPLFTPWMPDTIYKKNDTASYGGKNYLAIMDHTSTTIAEITDTIIWLPTQNINTYLSKDGVRQLPTNDPKNPNSRDIFNKLSANGYTTLRCEYKALTDPNHFCKKLSDSYTKWCNTLKLSDRSSHPECDSIPKYQSKQTTLGDASGITATLYSNAPAPAVAGSGPTASQISKCQNSDCPRNPKIDKKQCASNCTKCGNTTC